jgi:hypothetical protein
MIAGSVALAFEDFRPHVENKDEDTVSAIDN